MTSGGVFGRREEISPQDPGEGRRKAKEFPIPVLQ